MVMTSAAQTTVTRACQWWFCSYLLGLSMSDHIELVCCEPVLVVSVSNEAGAGAKVLGGDEAEVRRLLRTRQEHSRADAKEATTMSGSRAAWGAQSQVLSETLRWRCTQSRGR